MEKLALISVSDKAGIVEFANTLVNEFGYRILSTGGTAKALLEAGIAVTLVEAHTGFPEMMEGRLKTLHPKIHGGILCDRDKPEHTQSAEEHDIPMIDLVVVNLYPFEQTIQKPGVTDTEAIENIDIGGPTLIRAAAKNHKHVTVIVDPDDYESYIDSLRAGSDALPLRRRLAQKVYAHTSRYDGLIAKYMEGSGEEPNLEELSGYPEDFQLSSQRASILRYGENPHQQAALYGNFFERFKQLQGKQLSYCNILDISAAANLMGEFQEPTLAILKHTNPCGVASAEDLPTAWDLAYETDKQAPFGGIIIVNRTVDRELYERISQIWCEIIIAPNFTDEATEAFSKKKNLRLLVANQVPDATAIQDIRSVAGGYLVQDADYRSDNPMQFEVVTERQPSDEEMASMLFGWKVVKHVKSNAIVYTQGTRTLGIGAGQMSRVDSSKVAVWKAADAGLSLQGSTMASDALIPFPDGLIAAAEAGATACIQTGGSVRDEEVIKAANEHRMTMVFTGKRHFKH